MGQREIGKLTIFDFIVAISMGSVAGSSLANPKTHMVGPVTSLATLALVDIIVAFVSLKFSRARRMLEGEPVIVIQNGRILEKTMRNARLNLDNLLMGLRKKNILSPADAEFAILESDGSISVIPKSQARPVTPADLGIATKYEGLATVLVEDGNILEDNLQENQLTKEWLLGQLRFQGITRVDDVMAAILDTKGRLYISRKTEV
jgi:uncharacterized membrane protein YcaP (DUF421 family)